MGSVFRSNFIITSHLAVYLDALKEKNDSLELYGMTLEKAHPLSSITHSAHQWGLILGSEAHGISEDVQSCITTNIHIPGHGQAESLNVGIASGIALYHFSLLTSQ
jgi:TrmH family RNA methyltransferase